MNHKMTQPRQGRHIRAMPLLTELKMFWVRVATTMSRRWRWEFATATQRLARLYERKLAALAALKKSLLHQAFTGEL